VSDTITLLVFARCVGFVFRAPGFSHPSVPAPLRAGIALLVALGIAPGVERGGLAAMTGAVCAFACASEFLVGAGLGLGVSVLYDAAYAAGRAVDDYVGVKAIAPSVQIVAPSGFGRIWSLIFTGGFFLTGAYRSVMLLLAQSFVALPVAGSFDASAWALYAARFAATFAAIGALIAGPAIALALLGQVAVAALGRAVPRFGGVTLGFPLAFGAATIATAIAAPALLPAAFAPPFLAPYAHAVR
jgi:flagellar biosynthetic protein FliR